MYDLPAGLISHSLILPVTTTCSHGLTFRSINVMAPAVSGYQNSVSAAKTCKASSPACFGSNGRDSRLIFELWRLNSQDPTLLCRSGFWRRIGSAPTASRSAKDSGSTAKSFLPSNNSEANTYIAGRPGDTVGALEGNCPFGATHRLWLGPLLHRPQLATSPCPPLQPLA